MNKILGILLASLFLSAYGALAHTDGNLYGTPKIYCENLKGDTNVHDYLVNGATLGYILWGTMDGNLEDCDGDGVPGDYDGHAEFATGGAWLLVQEVGAGPWGTGSGATICFGEAAHHPMFPDIWVFDHVWPSGILFLVGIDTTNFPITDPSTGTTTDCGDGVDDADTGYCEDHCSLSFAPGLDGAYHVYVVNEIFGNGITDGQVIDVHESDQTGLEGHAYCLQAPADQDFWRCVHTNRNLQSPNPHLALAGHVYT